MTNLSRVRIIYLLTTFFLVALSFYSFTQIKSLIDSSGWVNHTNQVKFSLAKISVAVLEAQTSQQSFLLTGDSSFLVKRDGAFQALASELKQVDSLTKDNPLQIKNLQILREVLDGKIVSMEKVMQGYSQWGMSPELKLNIAEGLKKTQDVQQVINTLSSNETNLLQQRTKQYFRLAFLTPLYFIVLFLGALLILYVSYLRINNALEHSRRLRKSLENEKTFAQTILDSSPDNIIVIDKDLRYLLANPAASRILNNIEPDYVGKKVIDIFPNTDSLGDIQRALKGETVHLADYYSRYTNAYFEIVYTPLKSEDKIIGVIAQSRDISQTLKLNKKLEEQNLILQKMNQELQSFAYISSHDLQEPLRKIQIFAGRIAALELENLSDNGKDMFDRIRKAAQSMQTLISDLFDYSRANLSERIFETIDLNEIVEEVKENFKEDLEQQQAIIASDELCIATIIPFQLRQVMHNLIGNSLKFSKPGTPLRIKIAAEIADGAQFNNEQLSPGKNYCHIAVSDNGIGFEQEYNEKIFEVFQKLHRKDIYMGTGIGLAIVKKVIENHNGIITAQGELGKGARFDIFIPQN